MGYWRAKKKGDDWLGPQIRTAISICSSKQEKRSFFFPKRFRGLRGKAEEGYEEKGSTMCNPGGHRELEHAALLPAKCVVIAGTLRVQDF